MKKKSHQKASLFLPCLADVFYPAIGLASMAVLEAAGFAVDYPQDQTCCGQWARNQGHETAARAMARHFIRVFNDAPLIVSPSGSCILTVRQYPELFEDDRRWREKARQIAGRAYELTDFLVNVAGVTDLGARLSVRAAFHDSCHPLRGLGIKEEPRLLLKQVEGLELVEMESEICCGFGGSFMAQYPPLSNKMAEARIRQARDAGAEMVILSEPGCLLNLDTVLNNGLAPGEKPMLKAVHIAEILAGGTGLAD